MYIYTDTYIYSYIHTYIHIPTCGAGVWGGHKYIHYINLPISTCLFLSIYIHLYIYKDINKCA
jgi:hypothetical protein